MENKIKFACLLACLLAWEPSTGWSYSCLTAWNKPAAKFYEDYDALIIGKILSIKELDPPRPVSKITEIYSEIDVEVLRSWKGPKLGEIITIDLETNPYGEKRGQIKEGIKFFFALRSLGNPHFTLSPCSRAFEIYHPKRKKFDEPLILELDKLGSK